MKKIDDFREWAKENNWKITLKNNGVNIPKGILERYSIPKEYRTFLEKIETCVNESENVWFLCIDDYFPKSKDAFRWNEFEIMSLEAAKDDPNLINGIRNFWNKHFPIIMSVKGEYEYFAINVDNNKIVYGYEPEFEESNKIIANNFEDFLDKIVNEEIEL